VVLDMLILIRSTFRPSLFMSVRDTHYSERLTAIHRDIAATSSKRPLLQQPMIGRLTLGEAVEQVSRCEAAG
jgi:hypothetical protein